MQVACIYSSKNPSPMSPLLALSLPSTVFRPSMALPFAILLWRNRRLFF